MQAARFVGLEDLGANRVQLADLFVGDSHEVDGFRLEGIECAPIDEVQSQEDKVTEVFRLF